MKVVSQDPNYPSLHTEKKNTADYGSVYVSRAGSKMRVAWNFDSQDPSTIVILGISTDHDRMYRK